MALEALQALTPAVEGVSDPDDPAFGRILLGIEGLQRLWGDETEIRRRARQLVATVLPGTPRTGIANTRFGASVAATLGCVAPAGDAAVERAWLADQPIRCLPTDTATRARLRRFGLARVGDLAALPRSSVVARFGAQGGLLHDLANGLDGRPLRPRRPVERLRAELEPDTPLDGLEPLRFILRHLCDGLCEQLVARGAAVDGATLALTLEDALVPAVVIEQHLPEPVARPEAIERLLLARLEQVRLEGRIGRVALELDGRAPGEGRQLGLFEPQGARAERFTWELAALAIRFPGQLWRAALVDPEDPRTDDRVRWDPVGASGPGVSPARIGPS